MNQQLLKSEIRDETDVVSVRKKAREIAAALGFDSQDQIRTATAVSEIARNAYEYARGGMVEYKLINERHVKFVITIRDKGPGIPNLDQILRGSYVSPQGMGLGIMGAKRLLDEVHIETAVGEGTTVTLKKNVPHRHTLLNSREIKELTEKLMVGGNSPMEELQRQNQEILMAVTELKEKKEELTRINQELEDTNRGVVALYAELDEKAEILRVANESKTSFLSDMTHEFRSPLNSILSISQILLGEAKKDGAPEREKQVNFIIKAARGLSDLVNDLLDIAKIEAGKITVRPSVFPISDIMSSLRGLMRPIGGNEKVVLHFESGEEVNMNTDEAKLTQILRNLISNALKYTEAGDVTVKFSLLPDDRVCFTVSDTGIGIPHEHLDHIFEEFFQVDNPHQQFSKGTGLGLPLSRKLAHLLGGDIWVESEVGKGSSFHVEVPLHYTGPNVVEYTIPPSNLNKIIPQQNAGTARKKILVVDDEESVRYGIKTILADLKVDIREAQNGEEGFELARHYQPDLVVLDLVMPKRDGMDFLRDCMENLATRSLPVILHTSKPLDPEEWNYLDQVTSAILLKHENSFETVRQTVIKILGLKPESN